MKEQQQSQQGASDGASKRKAPGRPFQKGGDKRQFQHGALPDTVAGDEGGEVRAGDDRVAVSAGGGVDYEEAILHVAANGKGLDRTEMQRHARRMAEDSPKTFMEEVKRISGNRAGQGVAVTNSPAAPPPRDMGTERALELCEKLLKEWEEQERGTV